MCKVKINEYSVLTARTRFFTFKFASTHWGVNLMHWWQNRWARCSKSFLHGQKVLTTIKNKTNDVWMSPFLKYSS
jgi:hypothetical protein